MPMRDMCYSYRVVYSSELHFQFMLSFCLTDYRFRIVVPFILLLGTLFSMDQWIELAQNNKSLVLSIPYAILSICLVCGFLFKQMRFALVSFGLLIIYYLIQTRLQIPLNRGTTLLELSILSFLLPVGCFLAYVVDEMHFTFKQCLLYLSTLAVMALWGNITLAYFTEAHLEHWTQGVLFSIDSVSKLPFVLILYSIIMIGISALFVIRYNRIFDIVIYATLLFTSCVFISFDTPYISSVFFTLLASCLVFYLLSSSHELAFIDSLTKIANRQAFNSDAARIGKRYAVAMIDVDHFKQFNDRYGHDVGDQVLQLVASRIEQTLDQGKAYRFGGEEFVVLYRYKEHNKMKENLEAIRQTIESYPLTLRDEHQRPSHSRVGSQQRGQSTKAKSTTQITVSIGAALSKKHRSLHDTLICADKALYQAKRRGRNQVIIDRD
ncbi:MULTISPECIES: GGDEF domain-containing protein [unclassified Vibrio]|uniref:diguanylate cyclase n=1 Tax=Vibrio sp. HB236076 TaxID=3232307 RepID=A0AB39HKA6_9VIBR|nr:GGDEF domain-containing protein [Vibrio sp. HB161653]MDP5252968.1 GGDEF domain-containing protein [Vibrio sp. HB161653]